MPASINLIRRYVWLIETIRRAGPVPMAEINARWRDNRSINHLGEFEIPARTFHRHREAIAEIFGIEIVCSRIDNTYSIADDSVFDRQSFAMRLYNTLAVEIAVDDNTDARRHIRFDTTSGGENLIADILRAISTRRRLWLRFEPFDDEQPSEHTVRPVFLRQAGRRWYMVVQPEADTWRTVYPLDRIASLRITDIPFEPAPYSESDIDTYFDEAVGACLDPDYDCEDVTVRIFGRQCAYTDSLPLHQSQQIVARTEEYTDYSYRVRPSYTFIHAILGLGPAACVLSPDWVREEIEYLARQTLARYI